MSETKKLIIVINKNNYGLVDIDGNNVLDCNFENIIQFENDTYAILKDQKYQLYDSQLNLLNKNKFISISYNRNNEYIVSLKRKGNKELYGLINSIGDWIIKPNYIRLKIFKPTDKVWYLCEDFKSITKVYDHNGNILKSWNTENSFYIKYLGEGFFLKTDFHWSKESYDNSYNEKCDIPPNLKCSYSNQIIDIEKNPIDVKVSDNYMDEKFENGVIKIIDNVSLRFYDATFTPFFNSDLYYGEKGSNGFIAIKIFEDSNSFFVNEKCEKQFNRSFLNCEEFKDGYAWVEELDGRKGIIDVSGKFICPSYGKLKEGFGESNYAIVNKSNTNWIINKKGEYILKLSNSYINLTKYNCYIEYHYNKNNDYVTSELKNMKGEILFSRYGFVTFSVTQSKYGVSIWNGENSLIINKNGITKIY